MNDAEIIVMYDDLLAEAEQYEVGVLAHNDYIELTLGNHSRRFDSVLEAYAYFFGIADAKQI